MLKRYAESVDTSDPFTLGMLLHIYTDYLWDKSAIQEHMAAYKGDEWFLDYRKEINLASSYLFHHSDKIRKLWETAAGCDISSLPTNTFVLIDDLPGFLLRNHSWHIENDVGPSEFFSPEYVENFCKDAASSFKMFLQDVKEK